MASASNGEQYYAERKKAGEAQLQVILNCRGSGGDSMLHTRQSICLAERFLRASFSDIEYRLFIRNLSQSRMTQFTDSILLQINIRKYISFC